MYAFYQIFDWLGRHAAWTALAGFVLISTLAITWYFDRRGS